MSTKEALSQLGASLDVGSPGALRGRDGPHRAVGRGSKQSTKLGPTCAIWTTRALVFSLQRLGERLGALDHLRADPLGRFRAVTQGRTRLIPSPAIADYS